MAKKDFSKINTTAATAGNVYSTIEKSINRRGQQVEATPEEAKERADNLLTQGRKGCRAVRINMAFTPDNHDFVKTMAKITGQTMTEFVNMALEQYRKEHGDVYEKARELFDQMQK